MKLYGHSVSPYFERIMMMLEVKGQMDAVERDDIPGGFKSDQHLAWHPLGKIPFLVLDDGSSITESQCVCDYLDAVLDGPKTIPSDPKSAAKVGQITRAMDIYYTNSITPMGRVAFGGTSTDEELADARDRAIPEAFKYVDSLLSGGEFAVGDSWTCADATIVSHLYWYQWFDNKFDMPSIEAHPKLAAYISAISNNPISINSKARADASVKKFFATNS